MGGPGHALLGGCYWRGQSLASHPSFGPETPLECIDEVQAALKGGPLLFLDFAGCKEDTLASSVWVIVSGHLLFNPAP